MSVTHIPAELRRIVRERADHICEYCMLHEDDTYNFCQIDHVISEKHGGLTTADNLAYACAICNRNKGSDVGTLLQGSDDFIRLYNPRSDSWAEHFTFDGIKIAPLTNIAEATVRILKLNDPNRLIERAYLFDIGRYPPLEALRKI